MNSGTNTLKKQKMEELIATVESEIKKLESSEKKIQVIIEKMVSKNRAELEKISKQKQSLVNQLSQVRKQVPAK